MRYHVPVPGKYHRRLYTIQRTFHMLHISLLERFRDHCGFQGIQPGGCIWELHTWAGRTLTSFGTKERHTSKPNYSTAANTRRIRVYERSQTFQCF